MSEKMIVSWDEYNKTVEKLAIQIDESGYKPVSYTHLTLPTKA